MSYISTFERHARDALAISVLNKFRCWLLGRDKQLSGNRSEVMGKAIAALNGNIDLNDVISYYFKDSGEINNSVAFHLGRVFSGVLGDAPEKKKKFHVIISNLLATGNPGILLDTGDELEFVRDIIERSIDYLDDELAAIEISAHHSLIDTKGF